ncbi:GIY-YIG nuclease family protein [Flavobacteriaceae bacterium]|nr:GIY-YIG nuclease family protein [Flavobacteriaceae bacterium]
MLFNNNLGKFYIGETSNIPNRLKLHQQKAFHKSFTAKADD